MELNDRIRHIRQAGRIGRCHQWPKVESYRNGQHTWGVCVLLRLLWPGRPDLMDFALFHDVPEVSTGDIPSPAITRLGIGENLERENRRVFGLLRLPDEHALALSDWHILRAADSLDLWLWCWDEEALGNQAASQMKRSMDASFDKKNADGTLPPEAWSFIQDFRAEGWKWMDGVQ